MADNTDFNPFAAPESTEFVQEVVEFKPLPCPQCNSSSIKPTPYSHWYGRRAPKAIQDVTCLECGTNFNGENGAAYPPRRNPIFWFLLALFLFLIYVFVFFALPFIALAF